MYRGTIIVLCLFISSSFANTQQYSREQIEDIIFDFRVGIDSKIKEERLEQLLLMGEQVVPILIECLNDKLPEHLESKVQEKNRQRGNQMINQADSSSIPIQGWAETTLKRLGKPAVSQLIESIDTQPITISTVVRILGSIGDKRAIPSIINVLDNTKNNFSIRINAANALGKLGSTEAIPHLIEALKGQPDDQYNSYKLSNTAADSLAKITGQSFGFTLTFIVATKGGDKSVNFELNGNESEKEKTIKQWTEWWHNYEIQFSNISKFIDAFALSLSKSDTQAIESFRSSDYIQLIDGKIIDPSTQNNKDSILSNCTSILINSLENRKKVEYQIKCKNIKTERNNVIVFCEDKLLLEFDEYKRIFKSNTKRILVKDEKSYKIVQEDLSMWADRTYE